MADRSKEQLIENFMGITGVDEDRAKFYLESAGWKLDLAMAGFYEDDGDNDEYQDSIDLPPVQPPLQVLESSSREKGKGSSRSSSGSKNTRFGTISSIRAEEESDSSEEEGQAFYAGGSERSGQQVLGPPRKKGENKGLVDDLFKSAKEHGAQTLDSSESQNSPGREKAAFRGTGYRLGETEASMPQDVVRGRPLAEKPKQVDTVLKLWKNGFSIDDGILRDYNDPANKEFLDSIARGEVPKELLRQARGGEVNLNMEDHRNEDFVKPKVPIKAFAGEGHMLGSPVPNMVTKGSAVAPASVTAINMGTKGSAVAPTSATVTARELSVDIDESKPTTSLQIRLADGSRLVAKFNHNHKVRDVRRYIISSRPQYASSVFVLMTTFPNKELTNENETLEEGKLLNAVIVQKIK
ncbi:hypothetical protein CHS0354_005078 [Potamilus streckersoni]|uniref:NSFL1 cofactor p47 n=1 Tax=Potamilus streckersoni TaxID=2493646 RepID=A0AAE0SHM4_9BIVA|nr:hypothetical protein CHS0354_005078 [Potamilus streckersoni]